MCLVSLWLGHVFSNGMYVLFAVVGAYSTPFVLSPASRPDLENLLIYFSAWSVLFRVHAVRRFIGGARRGAWQTKLPSLS